MKLTATTRPVDETRCARLLLAWLEGDKLACDVVLDEVSNDDVGTAGLLFTVTQLVAELMERTVPDVRDQLRARLLLEQGEGR